MRNHAKICQRIQKKGTSPFRASRVDDGNAESSNLWPLPTTMINREHVTGCHRHVRQLNNPRTCLRSEICIRCTSLAQTATRHQKGTYF